ncbi:MAG TPA: hypothetical protein PLD47_02485 [Aggregatilineales bacterium]|nr:hypothetical protein [Anaerolineales bacterium]HRE46567.1 hypothetical protein [Aggregatilineales bacterium]
MHVSTAAELREALRTATSGTEIDLAPGEYAGPFFVDVPLHLRGQGRQTVLWRRAGAVLVVRSGGVRCDNLFLERTIRAGVLVAAHNGWQPVGVDSVSFDDNALIDLGELAPTLPFSLPLLIETTAAATVDPAGLYGAQITPDHVPAAGAHHLTLHLEGDALRRGELLFGEILIREGETTRRLWVSGVVGESAAPSLPLALHTGKHLIHVGAQGLRLDRPRAKAVGLESLRHMLVILNEGGMLSLFLPEDHNGAVTLNGIFVPPRARRPLKLGDSLVIGEDTLTLQAEAERPFTLDREVITFPEFRAGIPDPVTLTITAGKNGWRGEVLAPLAWVTVTPEGAVRLPAGRSAQWTLTLNESALALPNGTQTIGNGVLIIGGGHACDLGVTLTIARPPIALDAQPVDFGEVEAGLNASPTARVGIINYGVAAWKGRLQSAVSWLEVVPPTALEGGAWSAVEGSVRLLPDWKTLTVGTHTFKNALTVIPHEGSPLAIPIHVVVTPARGHLTLPNAQIGFQEVERNIVLPSQAFTLWNEGGAAWEGTLTARQGWVSVDPEEVIVPPHGTLEVRINLLSVPEEAALDQPFLVDELIFTPKGDSLPYPEVVPVSLTVVERPPFLAVQPVRFPPFVRGELPEGSLTIYNLGPTWWEGTIRAAHSWLVVPERRFTCPPEETITIPISLSDKAQTVLKVGISTFEKAIAVQGGREPLVVSAYFDVRDEPEGVILETPTLNFGQIGDSITNTNPQVIRLLNAGAATWTGMITLNLDWLSFEHPTRTLPIEIPKGSTAEIKIFLADKALRQLPGIISENEAITISGGGQEIVVRVMLVLSESAPWVAINPPAISLRSGEETTFKVTNEGGRAWTLSTHPAPYLLAEPAEFTLDPGKAQVITIRVDPAYADLPSESFSDPRGVVIIGPSRESDLTVNVVSDTPLATERVAAHSPKLS